MWVYPFEFRETSHSKVSVHLRFAVRQSTSGLLIFLLSDVRHTFSYSNKYNQTNSSAGLLPKIIVPTIQLTANNQFGISHLTCLHTYFPDLLTIIDYMHIQIHLLTYLPMCFKCICMKGKEFDRLLHVVYV